MWSTIYNIFHDMKLQWIIYTLPAKEDENVERYVRAIIPLVSVFSLKALCINACQ